MSVESRTIVGAPDVERVAVVTIAIPAGGEVGVDPTWRFHGWLVERDADRGFERMLIREAPRIVIEGDDESGYDVRRTR